MRVCGVDIAARADRTACAFMDGWRLTRIQTIDPPIEYPEILDIVRDCCKRADRVIQDQSGVGDPVYSVLRDECPNLIGVRFTGGDTIKMHGRNWTTGKAGLVQLLHAAVSSGKLVLDCPEDQKRALRDEMTSFRMIPGRKPGTWKYEAAAGAHDDILMAAALAVLGTMQASKAGAAQGH